MFKGMVKLHTKRFYLRAWTHKIADLTPIYLSQPNQLFCFDASLTFLDSGQRRASHTNTLSSFFLRQPPLCASLLKFFPQYSHVNGIKDVSVHNGPCSLAEKISILRRSIPNLSDIFNILGKKKI